MTMRAVKCNSQKLTSSVNLLDQSSAFGVKRHSSCLFELLGSLCGYNDNKNNVSILRWHVLVITMTGVNIE